MDLIWQKFTEWLKELLISGIMDNVNGLFDNVNSRVAGIAGQVGATPQGWNSGIYGMIRTLSDNVILPIAGVILAFVMTLELIQLITEKNNMHDVDTWMFFKWIFKTACAVLIVTNTWNIVMGVFEAAQSVVNSASGIIVSDTSLTFNEHIAGFDAALAEMEVWSLLGLWLESVVVHLSMWALTICIFIICYGRMIEIYCVTSIAPIPMATMANREWGQMGQNYLRSLLALGFQGFLIYKTRRRNMNAQDRYNSERYPDMTCFLALRNIERNERKERRNRMKENWIYRRGDVYLANLDPYIGSEQGGTRPVVVLQNNTGNYYCPTLIIAPITSKAGKKPSQPTHYYAERIHGLDVPGMVLLEQIKTIDKRRVKKYLGRMTRQQMDEIGEAIEEALGLYVPEEMEAP